MSHSTPTIVIGFLATVPTCWPSQAPPLLAGPPTPLVSYFKRASAAVEVRDQHNKGLFFRFRLRGSETAPWHFNPGLLSTCPFSWSDPGGCSQKGINYWLMGSRIAGGDASFWQSRLDQDHAVLSGTQENRRKNHSCKFLNAKRMRLRTASDDASRQ